MTWGDFQDLNNIRLFALEALGTFSWGKGYSAAAGEGVEGDGGGVGEVKEDGEMTYRPRNRERCH